MPQRALLKRRFASRLAVTWAAGRISRPVRLTGDCRHGAAEPPEIREGVVRGWMRDGVRRCMPNWRRAIGGAERINRR